MPNDNTPNDKPRWNWPTQATREAAILKETEVVMDKAEKFKKLWRDGRNAIDGWLVHIEKRDTNYFILRALDLLLEAKERRLFPEDFKEE